MLRIIFILFLFPLFSSAQSDTLEEDLYAKRKNEHAADNFRPDMNMSKLRLDTVAGILYWYVVREKEKQEYKVEEMRWGKFYAIGKTSEPLKISNDTFYYSMQVPYDSGLYYLRVMSVDEYGLFKGRSMDVPVERPVVPTFVCKGPVFEFDRAGRYEVVDKYGTVVKKGYSATILRTDLPEGVYYLNYGNMTTEFIIKK